jgi:hypothetical protein
LEVHSHSDLLTLHPKRNEHAITTILPDGNVAIIQLGSTVGFTLSPAGAVLWELSDGQSSLQEIISSVCEILASEAISSGSAEIDRKLLTEQLISLTENLLSKDYLAT